MHAIGKVVQRPYAARGNHGHGYRIGHGTGQRQIKPAFGAVTVHAGEQNFTRTACGHVGGPGHGIQTRIGAPAVAEDIPARANSLTVRVGSLLFGGGAPLGIDGHHDALRSVFGRGVTDQLRVGNGRRVEAHFVRSGVEQTAHVLHAAHPTAHRQRDKHFAGYRFNDVQDEVASIAGGGDVQKGQFIGTLGVVTRRNLDGVTGIAQTDKVHALDHAATGHVQAGDDAFGQHAQATTRRRCQPCQRPAAGTSTG